MGNILTMDFGSQSVRAAIFDKNGNELAMEKHKYNPPYFSVKPNYAEQDPNLYYDSLCECTKKLAEKHKDLLSTIDGITITCFRDSAVLLDKDMNIVRPMILWLDQRAAKCEKPLPFLHRLAFGLVGMSETINLNRKRAAANWIQENEPENWAKTDKYISLCTYFVYRLTGELKGSASDYAGHYPIDFKKKKFYKNPEKHMKGQIFGIKGSMLPTIVEEGSLIGTITEQASKETGLLVGTKLYACGSDKSCETLGLGVLDDRTAAISYGTASTVETTTKKYIESETFLPGYAACIPGYYNMDVQIYRGYWMINWFLKEFGGKKVDDIVISDVSAEDFNKSLELVPPGSDGLVLQPYWGPGLARPLAKGAMIGFSDAVTKNHFYRAIIEGIAYALRESLEHFEKKLHHKIPEIRISGGGSQSDEICQITADIMGRPVSRVQTFETSSLGAAVAGFLATGEYKKPEDAVKAMVKPGKRFEPNMENHEIYNYLYKNAYRKIYPKMKGVYKDIKKFNIESDRKNQK